MKTTYLIEELNSGALDGFCHDMTEGEAREILARHRKRHPMGRWVLLAVDLSSNNHALPDGRFWVDVLGLGVEDDE